MKQRIADLSDIRSGYQFREKVEHDPHVLCPLSRSRTRPATFSCQTHDLIQVTMAKTEPYRVQQSDVLFLARGHRLGAAPVIQP